MSLRAAWLLVFATGAAHVPVAAAETLPEAIATAKELMLGGRSQDAQTLLAEAAKAHAQNEEVNFLLGMLAIEASDYDEAIRRFRRILTRHPKAVRVRLELARAFYIKRDFANAARQFRFARAGNPAPGVIANIDRFLGTIGKQKTWSYNFGFAIAPDTNINSGSSAEEVVLFGLPFALGEDSRSRSGVGFAVDGSVEYVPMIGEWGHLRAGAAFQRRDYQGQSFDDMTITAHAGPQLALAGWDVSILGTGFQRRLGNQKLSEGAGLKVEAARHIGGNGFTLGASAHQVRYPDYPLQDGPALSAWGGVIRAITAGSGVTGRLGFSRKEARVAELASWSGSLSVGYFRDLPGGLSVYAEPAIAVTRYDAPDPFFGERRSDRSLELRLAVLNRRIEYRGFTPRLGITIARRQSTINLYDSSQRRVELGLTKSF